MAQEDQDKTEQPTSHRLEEARKRGEVAKSVDVVGTMVMIVFATALAMTASWLAAAFAAATRRMVLMAGEQPVFGDELLSWVGRTYAPVWQALTPIALALLVAAVAANVLQTGLMFTTHPLKPDFKRMNPAQTIKRIFSLRTVWEFGKLVLKLSFLVGLCAVMVWKARALVEASASTMPGKLPSLFQDAFVKTSLYVLAILAVMAVVDWMFTRREFTRRMRMSRRELRDEVKRKDGDPAVKSKQRQQIRELLKKTRSVQRVAEADVVLTNPTHVAVALQYSPGKMRAPVVLAKGAGFLSARIREVARRSGVPIERSPLLARALYGECDIDAPVPEHLYTAIAPFYRRLWEQRRQAVP